MSGQDAAEIGGCCGVFCFSILNSWCGIKAYGSGNGRAGCCGGPRGCCHSCFSEGFDEDAWDKKDGELRKKQTAANQAKSTQPTPTPQMAAPAVDDANATK
ncbi:hypothetical protein FRC08_009762 [Ceratobasidium sp. 394]|nr:hypothetical protein FRC08_009762 [Ceratobasidium sp. 394]